MFWTATFWRHYEVTTGLRQSHETTAVCLLLLLYDLVEHLVSCMMTGYRIEPRRVFAVRQSPETPARQKYRQSLATATKQANKFASRSP